MCQKAAKEFFEFANKVILPGLGRRNGEVSGVKSQTHHFEGAG
jgi:hypothetical protein